MWFRAFWLRLSKMSFLSVIKHIWGGVETFANIAAPAEPEIAMIPMVGAPFAAIIQGITLMEKILPGAGAGPQKKVAVTAITNAAVPGIDQGTLSTVIDEVVQALNAMAAAQDKLGGPGR